MHSQTSSHQNPNPNPNHTQNMKPKSAYLEKLEQIYEQCGAVSFTSQDIPEGCRRHLRGMYNGGYIIRVHKAGETHLKHTEYTIAEKYLTKLKRES